MRGGRTVDVDPVPGVDDGLLCTYLEGPVLAHLLEQRGAAVLHGSVVRFGCEAVAFLGGSGSGKSTLAAALRFRGHRVIGDDLTPLVISEGRVVVLPTSGSLRLWDDSLRGLELDPSRFECLHDGVEKRVLPIATAHRDRDRAPRPRTAIANREPRPRLRLRRGLRARERLPTDGPIPLGFVCVLDQSPAIAFAPLAPQDALRELLRQSYCVHLLERVVSAARFRILAQAVRQAPTARLSYPRDFGQLSAVVDRLEEAFHVAS